MLDRIAPLLVLAAVAGCPSGRTFVPPEGTVLFSDEFDTGELAEGWVFDGSDPGNMSLDARPGFVRILAEPPSQDDEGPLSLLLREASGDFVLTARMEFDPTADRHIAGLVVEDEDGQRLSFGLLKASGPRGSFRGIVPVAEDSADLNIDATALSYEGTSVYLRMERVLDSFDLAYSADGETYTNIGTVTSNLSDSVRVGVGSAIRADCNANCESIEPADFDFFEISRVE